jgi:YD repeat-containing protein
VEASTGLFVHRKTDLMLPDVIPIVLTRTYRPADGISRGFGKGASHPYDILLLGDTVNYAWFNVQLADGANIHYVRTTPGTGFSTDLVLEHTATPTRWYKSRITWNGTGWNLTFKDGTVYTFPDGFSASQPAQTALLSIRDRFGNTLRVHRENSGNITAITSPNGRSISFTYDTSFRITQARDSLGRTVSYTYDGLGRVATVTDPAGGVTSYTYDTAHRMLTITDPRGIHFRAADGARRSVSLSWTSLSTVPPPLTMSPNGRVSPAAGADAMCALPADGVTAPCRRVQTLVRQAR